MLKICGLAGLMISAGLAGIITSAQLKERIRILQDYMQMILELKGNINYFREPLISLCKNKGEKADSEAFELLIEVISELEEKDAEIGQIWAQNVDIIYGNTCLEKDDIQLLKYPGSFIGQTDFENQAAKFQYFEKRLGEQIEKAEECYSIKGPLYRKLGFFAGGLAVIVLI